MWQFEVKCTHAVLQNDANRHSVTIHTDLARGLPPAMADRVQLQQVRWGVELPMSVGAVAMNSSTIIVAVNAQLLRRLKLQRAVESRPQTTV